MKTLSHVVEFWTHSWLEFQHKTSLSLRPTRPSIVRQLSSGSGTLSTPGYLMRRDSSFKMQFDDLFGIDGDDVFGNTGTLRRKDSAAGAVPLLSDTEEAGWTSLTGEFAISSSDTSGPFTNPDFKFSNWGIGTINTTIEDINWIGKVVVEEIWGSDEMKVNLDSYYIWLLRFSFDCPFRDVRKGCKNILLRAEVGPSNPLPENSSLMIAEIRS
jgi:hypothetical protein